LYNGTLSEQESNDVKQLVKRIDVVELPDTYYCCIASTQGYDHEGIQNAWQKMREFLGSQGIQMDTKKSVGFCWDNKWFTPLDVCRYECGYQIDSLEWGKAQGIAARTRPAGRYLVIEYKGSLLSKENFYLWLLSEYLPSTTYELMMPFVIERYIDIDCESGVFHLEVQIKVK